MIGAEEYRGLERAAQAVGYAFRDSILLLEALTHRSYAVENPSSPVGDNGRLSLVGDAVISLVVGERLFMRYPGLSIGGISSARAAVVSGISLARASRRLGLGHYMYLGKGESSDGGHEKESILADLFEAVVCAIFLDGGLESARTFVLAQLEKEMDRAVSSLTG